MESGFALMRARNDGGSEAAPLRHTEVQLFYPDNIDGELEPAY
ncbi:hypothetical protein ABIA43_004702 [Bradyrhizobium sp. USDA 328]|jgi:hypothetical protein